MQWRETKLNSCDTQKALDQLHQASGGAALGGLIGVAVPSIGAASALVGVWAWQNQDALRVVLIKGEVSRLWKRTVPLWIVVRNNGEMSKISKVKKMKNILLLLLAVAALAVIILWWQNLISPGILAVILVLLAVAGVGTRVWSENTGVSRR